jgi:hypothetical protein
LPYACYVLAFCDMRTLYLRNVPDEVGERLERLADRAHMSLSAYVVYELTELSRRADNPSLLGDLPHSGVWPDDVLADLDAGRSVR